MLIFGCFTREDLIMAESSTADSKLRENIIKRFNVHNLDEGWYGPYIGKNYANREYDGKRILVIDAAWWYDLSSSSWMPSNIFWTMDRFECYSGIVEKGDAYQTEKPQSPFQKLKKSIDAFSENGGRDTARQKIGLPNDMKDTISVQSNVEKDEYGVIKRLENTFKNLNLDLDKNSIAFHRVYVRPFEEPLIMELGNETDGGLPQNLGYIKKRINQIFQNDAKKACEVLDDVLRICQPDMVVFDCYQSMLNVATMLESAKGLSLYDYMRSLNMSFFGLHNLFVDEPEYWSCSHTKINDDKGFSEIAKASIVVDDMTSCLKRIFSSADSSDCCSCTDVLLYSVESASENANLLDMACVGISKIRLLAELLSEGLVKGIENEIDDFMAGLTEDELRNLLEAIYDNAVVKLGPPIEELREGVNIDAFEFMDDCVMIKQAERTELEEFLLHEIQNHGSYERIVLLKKQGYILNNPKCQDPEILRRSLDCLTKMQIELAQKQTQRMHKNRIGSYVKSTGVGGVNTRTNAARAAKKEKGLKSADKL